MLETAPTTSESDAFSQESITSTLPPYLPPRRSYFAKHPVVAFLLLLLLSLTAAISLYLLVQMRTMALSKIEPSPTPTPTATPNPTSTWKTYTDLSRSLEFKYPNDLSSHELENGVVIFENNVGKTKFNLTGFQTLNLIDYQKYLKTQTADNNLRHLTIFTDSHNRAWETDMTLGEVFNYTAIWSNLDKYYVLTLQSGYDEEGDSGESFRQFANQLLTTVKVKDCSKNNALNLELTIPEGWDCIGLVDDKDTGAITLESNEFQIEIADGGRGPFCGDGEDLDGSCKTSSLTLSPDWIFTVYNSEGEDKEIFGGLGKSSRDTNRWISIKYPNMETKKLTPLQKTNLLKFLNSIRFTN